MLAIYGHKGHLTGTCSSSKDHRVGLVNRAINIDLSLTCEATPAREDVDIVPTIVDENLSYIPWGGDNL